MLLRYVIYITYMFLITVIFGLLLYYFIISIFKVAYKLSYSKQSFYNAEIQIITNLPII